MIIVVGPMHSGASWCFNTARQRTTGPLREQFYLGSYDRAPGAFPEALAAYHAARINLDRVVEVWNVVCWRAGKLVRRLVVPARWLEVARVTLEQFEADLILLTEAT